MRTIRSDVEIEQAQIDKYNEAGHVLGSKLLLAKRTKQDSSRSGQTSLATAGTNFTKLRTRINFGPSTLTHR